MIVRSTLVRASLFAGLVAGIIDIAAAALINHAGPGLILQSVASGLLGLASYQGGATTMLLGLFLQLSMSIIIAGIYAVTALWLRPLLRRPLLFGLLYGLGVFSVMNLLVVPLSAFAPRPAHLSLTWIGLNILAMLFFGTIVALLVRREFDRSGAARVESSALAER